jgi:hypothetical protein
MRAKLDAVAAHLFASVMAPLVLGGAMQPANVIGARAAAAFGDLPAPPAPAALVSRVQDARVRRARLLVAVDDLGPPTGAEWALAAALHDVLQAVNPKFDTPLRRGAARRIVELAGATIDRVRAPANVHEALARHSWFARVLDIARTDTTVAWWIGSRAFLGVDPPARLQAWPELRRVSVERVPHPLLELAPLAIDRERLVEAISKLLSRTPLSDLATCTRTAPPFVWGDTTLALVATPAGRALTLRALSRLPAERVDAALGRATRDAFAREALAGRRELARGALALLGDRAIAEALGHVAAKEPAPLTTDAIFARSLGIAEAMRTLTLPDSRWPEAERQMLLSTLERSADRAPSARPTPETAV